MGRIQRALLSVSNKQGLVDLASALHRREIALLSSGGTAKLLAEHGLDVTTVSAYTGAPEILGGRVKTLHPKIFGGILGRDTPEHRQQMAEHDIGAIDLVVVNLYPFEQTIAAGNAPVEQAIEQVDIGGPSLVRAAAKNHERVVVVVDPDDYETVVAELDANGGQISDSLRRQLAARAFAYTAAYDAAISNYFYRTLAEDAWPEYLSLQVRKVQRLRYGENPHQSGAFYATADSCNRRPTAAYEQLQGKELSYNNFVDVEAAWALVQELPDTAVCVIKHTNPCGAASVSQQDAAAAFRKALETDPVSAFGGIVGCNQVVDQALAEQLKELFLEAVVAPDFTEDALNALRKKKKLRLVRAQPRPEETAPLWRAALGGVLLQDEDTAMESIAEAKVVTSGQPTAEQVRDLQFAWIVCKHVKSNAIVLAKNGQLVGVGAGQMSRVDSVQLAIKKAKVPTQGSVLASDAFFPFRDGLDEAARAGVVAAVEPGGSVRDEEVIAAANEHHMALVFSGVRHFKH